MGDIVGKGSNLATFPIFGAICWTGIIVVDQMVIATHLFLDFWGVTRMTSGGELIAVAIGMTSTGSIYITMSMSITDIRFDIRFF